VRLGALLLGADDEEVKDHDHDQHWEQQSPDATERIAPWSLGKCWRDEHASVPLRMSGNSVPSLRERSHAHLL
jgi:hypothetical protein